MIYTDGNRMYKPEEYVSEYYRRKERSAKSFQDSYQQLLSGTYSDDTDNQLDEWNSGFIGTVKHAGLGFVDSAAFGIPHYLADKVGFGNEWGEPDGLAAKIGGKLGGLVGFLAGGPMKVGGKAATKALPFLQKGAVKLAGTKFEKAIPGLLMAGRSAVGLGAASATVTPGDKLLDLKERAKAAVHGAAYGSIFGVMPLLKVPTGATEWLKNQKLTFLKDLGNSQHLNKIAQVGANVALMEFPNIARKAPIEDHIFDTGLSIYFGMKAPPKKGNVSFNKYVDAIIKEEVQLKEDIVKQYKSGKMTKKKMNQIFGDIETYRRLALLDDVDRYKRLKVDPDLAKIIPNAESMTLIEQKNALQQVKRVRLASHGINVEDYIPKGALRDSIREAELKKATDTLHDVVFRAEQVSPSITTEKGKPVKEKYKDALKEAKEKAPGTKKLREIRELEAEIDSILSTQGISRQEHDVKLQKANDLVRQFKQRNEEIQKARRTKRTKKGKIQETRESRDAYRKYQRNVSKIIHDLGNNDPYLYKLFHQMMTGETLETSFARNLTGQAKGKASKTDPYVSKGKRAGVKSQDLFRKSKLTDEEYDSFIKQKKESVLEGFGTDYNFEMSPDKREARSQTGWKQFELEQSGRTGRDYAYPEPRDYPTSGDPRTKYATPPQFRRRYRPVWNPKTRKYEKGKPLDVAYSDQGLTFQQLLAEQDAYNKAVDDHFKVKKTSFLPDSDRYHGLNRLYLEENDTGYRAKNEKKAKTKRAKEYQQMLKDKKVLANQTAEMIYATKNNKARKQFDRRVDEMRINRTDKGNWIKEIGQYEQDPVTGEMIVTKKAGSRKETKPETRKRLLAEMLYDSATIPEIHDLKFLVQDKWLEMQQNMNRKAGKADFFTVVGDPKGNLNLFDLTIRNADSVWAKMGVPEQSIAALNGEIGKGTYYKNYAKWMKLLHRHVVGEQASTRVGEGISNKIKLTGLPKMEKVAIRDIKKYIESTYKSLNDLRTTREATPLKLSNDYLHSIAQHMFDTNSPNRFKMIKKEALNKYRTKNKKAVDPIDVNRDYYETITAFTEWAGNEIFDSPVRLGRAYEEHFREMAKRSKPTDHIDYNKFADYARDWTNDFLGKPNKIDSYIQKNINKPIQKLISRYFPDYEEKNTHQVINEWNSLLWNSALGARPKTAIRNLFQTSLTVGEVGIKNVVEANQIRRNKPHLWNKIQKDNMVRKSREITGARFGLEKGIKDKPGFMAKWFMGADTYNVDTAFTAGYLYAQKANPKAGPKAWASHGNHVAAKTQWLYTKSNKNYIQRGRVGSKDFGRTVGRLAGIFTSWPANWLNLQANWYQGNPYNTTPFKSIDEELRADNETRRQVISGDVYPATPFDFISAVSKPRYRKSQYQYIGLVAALAGLSATTDLDITGYTGVGFPTLPGEVNTRVIGNAAKAPKDLINGNILKAIRDLPYPMKGLLEYDFLPSIESDNLVRPFLQTDRRY